MYSFADIVLKENQDFKRIVSFTKDGKTIEELPTEVIILTAISKPKRILEFLPKNINFLMINYPDHYNYTQLDIDKIKNKYPNKAIITTEKDMVKLKDFDFQNIFLMKLKIILNDDILNKINKYNY
jgi:tetraacyldisaccharide 4'-kinase